MVKGKRKREHDIWKRIKEHQKDPKYLRAAFEFIRVTTGKSSQ